MTDSTTTATAAAAAAKSSVKTVADDMDSRRIFDNVTEAQAYITAMTTTISDFGEQVFATRGINDKGEFDPAIYTDSMQVMVALLRKAKEGVKAIVVTPVPSLASLLADDAGTDWVKRIIEKELNHVAVRALREATDISTVVDQMPTTREGYISSARGEGGGILESFNELYKQISAALSAKVPVWAKFKLPKVELKLAMQSKGYATEFYPALENRGEGKDSLFVAALKLGVAGAKKKGLDSTIFERWLETRDAQAFASQDADDETFDFDSMANGLLTDAKTETAPAEEPAKVEEEKPADESAGNAAE